MEAILNKDTVLFYLINGQRNPFFDYLFGFLSHNLSFVIAILLAVIFLSIKKFNKHFWILLVLVALSFLLADRISVLCFKDVFQRLRPSHALEGVNLVNTALYYYNTTFHSTIENIPQNVHLNNINISSALIKNKNDRIKSKTESCSKS